jgi:hypothetical protein
VRQTITLTIASRSLHQRALRPYPTLKARDTQRTSAHLSSYIHVGKFCGAFRAAPVAYIKINVRSLVEFRGHLHGLQWDGSKRLSGSNFSRDWLQQTKEMAEEGKQVLERQPSWSTSPTTNVRLRDRCLVSATSGRAYPYLVLVQAAVI